MWKTGAGTQEDGLKSLREQFSTHTSCHDEIRAKFDAHASQAVYFVPNNVARKRKLGMP